MLTASAIALALVAHTPVLVHDSRERYPLASVAAADVSAPARGRDRRPTVYGRAVAASARATWLQYWLFYAEQDQDRGILRSGRHAGDWEVVQYQLDSRGHPIEAVYSQHSGAERCSWQTVRRREGRPLVYVARGSHASYLRPGTRDRMWPDPNDEANARGRLVKPRLVRIEIGSANAIARKVSSPAAPRSRPLPGSLSSAFGADGVSECLAECGGIRPHAVESSC